MIAEHHLGCWKPVRSITLEELRGLQAKCLPTHRTTIISKLAEYGHTYLSPVHPRHYKNYKRFLLSLKP